MNKEVLAQVVGQIDSCYIQEAIAQEKVLTDRRILFTGYQAQRIAVCIGIFFVVMFGMGVTAYAISDSFRETVISVLYPLYSRDEIKELDQGHMTGAFDPADVLLSFLDQFNDEKMKWGIRAEKQGGYSYSMHSDKQGEILAVVKCNVPNYKMLVTIKRVDYEKTAGVWQVVSYQIISDAEGEELATRIAEYVPDEIETPKISDNLAKGMEKAEDGCAIIYNTQDKEHIVVLTEQESREIAEIFEKCTKESDVTVMGLQNLVVRFEDVMYVFSVEGDVLIMEGNGASSPRARIELLEEDLELLLDIFRSHEVAF